MNADQKLTAIRDVIQRDVGNRGLARDPDLNLVNAYPEDFANACRSIADVAGAQLAVVTGFFIPSADPPTFETDGPLGAVFLARAAAPLNFGMSLISDPGCRNALAAGLRFSGLSEVVRLLDVPTKLSPEFAANFAWITHRLALERVGPAWKDGRCYTMRGRDVTDQMRPAHVLIEHGVVPHPAIVSSGVVPIPKFTTIGIGDGGNEIGMGKIPHQTIVRNIPNGDLIHCRVATDHLIVAGVSNWGAYALAAGVALLRGVKLPAELFDPNRERAILQTMVDAGPLVDGVTGKQTATVDGLSWEDYIRPLQEIGRILEA